MVERFSNATTPSPDQLSTAGYLYSFVAKYDERVGEEESLKYGPAFTLNRCPQRK